MCCKRKHAARRNACQRGSRNGVYERRPTAFRILVEHIVRIYQDKRALKQTREYPSTTEKQERGVVTRQEGRSSAEHGEREWVDEKKQLQMLSGGSSMREPAGSMNELPTYQDAVARN
jgi:hypothetical protein